MGLVEKIRNYISPPKETESISESQTLLELFYNNPFVAYYHSSGNRLTYTGDYDSLKFCYDKKGIPLLVTSEAYSMLVSFLWTDAKSLPRNERGIIKPYAYYFYESSQLIKTPFIEIVEGTNDIIDYKGYIHLWNKRDDQIKRLSG